MSNVEEAWLTKNFLVEAVEVILALLARLTNM